MKVLVLNQPYFVNDLKESGLDVISAGQKGKLDIEIKHFPVAYSTLLKLLPSGFVPDRILVHDNSAPIIFSGLEDLEVPTAFYSIDAHQHVEWQKYLKYIFDFTFVAQKDYLADFGSPEESCWLPLFAPHGMEPSPEKCHDVAFIGTLDRKLNAGRVEFFEALGKRVKIHIGSGSYGKVFPKSKIVINQTAKGDLNFRVFEAMMSGAMLITERTSNGLLELFSEGEHLVCYEAGNVEDAGQKILYYLANERKRAEIAGKGRDEVMKHHTMASRSREVAGILYSLKPRQRRGKHLGAFVNFWRLSKHIVDDYLAEVKALKLAIDAARKSLSLDEELPEEAILWLFQCCVRFDSLTKLSEGNKTLLDLSEKYVDNDFVRLIKIRTLLNSGLIQQARKEAAWFAEDHEEVFRTVDKVLTDLL